MITKVKTCGGVACKCAASFGSKVCRSCQVGWPGWYVVGLSDHKNCLKQPPCYLLVQILFFMQLGDTASWDMVV